MYWFMMVILILMQAVMLWLGVPHDTINSAMLITCIALIAELKDEWRSHNGQR